MIVGHAYQFNVKRRGTSKLVTYEGRLIGKVDDCLVFDNLGSAGGTIRVFESRVEGEPVELHIKDAG